MEELPVTNSVRECELSAFNRHGETGVPRLALLSSGLAYSIFSEMARTRNHNRNEGSYEEGIVCRFSMSITVTNP